MALWFPMGEVYHTPPYLAIFFLFLHFSGRNNFIKHNLEGAGASSLSFLAVIEITGQTINGHLHSILQIMSYCRALGLRTIFPNARLSAFAYHASLA